MLRFALVVLLVPTAFPQTVTFLEPVGNAKPRRSPSDPLPLYRPVPDGKYKPWLNHPAAARALWFYQQAFQIINAKGNPAHQPETYYVALVPGGNHAAIGLRVQTATNSTDLPGAAYILLSPDPYSFTSTFLHETGHVAMAMLAGGKQLQPADITSIPHTTAALTDRATAFSEGWAIHLETLNAHVSTEPADRARYHHEAVSFGGGPYPQDEYFRNAADLASYAQNIARYTEVRENHYAFAQAYQGPDYLRLQLEKARDFATLRTPNQLLQSEGFHASFFFLFTMRGNKVPAEDEIRARHLRMLQTMDTLFARVKVETGVPWLIEFVIEYRNRFPDEADAITTALNDLSHGVFIDPAAAALWTQHYNAALRLDLKSLNRDGISAARKRWLEAVKKEPAILRSRLGPQIPCQIAAVQVKVEMFGGAQPLLFDSNSAPAAMLQLIPGLTSAERERWIAARETKPFASLEDFRLRAGLTKQHCASPAP